MYRRQSSYSTTVDVDVRIGLMAQVYCQRDGELSVADVQDILDNVDNTRMSTRPPQKPSGGEVYVYAYGTAPTKGMISAHFTVLNGLTKICQDAGTDAGTVLSVCL